MGYDCGDEPSEVDSEQEQEQGSDISSVGDSKHSGDEDAEQPTPLLCENTKKLDQPKVQSKHSQ